MILRKPYAFLIKNFRLIHTIMTLCMIYLAYKNYLIFDYLRKFLDSGMPITSRDLTGDFFNSYMFILPWIIIVITIILLAVMIKKKKPKTLYIINIISFVAVIAINNYVYNTLQYMETNIITTQSGRLVMDFSLISTVAIVAMLIFSFIRSVGFDIKKFDFNKDLMELEIEEKDREEFEVNVNVETNVIQRGINRNKRFARYVYIENKYLINTIAIIVVATIAFFTYFNINIYNTDYNEGDVFFTNDFEMGITNSYLTSKNYRGEEATNNELLVIELYIRGIFPDEEVNLAKMELLIDDEKYFPLESRYKAQLLDLGDVYCQEKLSDKEFSKYLLVYEIPKSSKKDARVIRYINGFKISENKLNPKYIKIKLNPSDLDDKEKIKEMEFDNKQVVNDDNLKNTTMNFLSLDLAAEFKNDYKFCVVPQECYPSTEYVQPSLNTNYDKALLKFKGNLQVDENVTINDFYNLYNLLDYYGKLVYKKDDKTYTLMGPFSRVIPAKHKVKDEFYIEVDKDILDATSIDLLIQARNKEYLYKIK